MSAPRRADADADAAELRAAIVQLAAIAPVPKPRRTVDRLRGLLGHASTRRRIAYTFVAVTLMLGLRAVVPAAAIWVSEPIDTRVIVPGSASAITLDLDGRPWLGTDAGNILTTSARILQPRRFEWWLERSLREAPRLGGSATLERTLEQTARDTAASASSVHGPATEPADPAPTEANPFDQSQALQTSRVSSIVAASELAGRPVRTTGDGVLVMLPPLPSIDVDSRLRPGDRIEAIDGTRILTERQLAAVAARRERAGARRIMLTVTRLERPVTLVLPPAASAEREAHGILGFDAVTARPMLVGDPPPLMFTDRLAADAEGGSGGLAYGLAAYAAFSGTRITNGRMISATGILHEDGRIGAVEHIAIKAQAAAAAGARLLIVPAANASEIERARELSGIDVRPAATLAAALGLLDVHVDRPATNRGSNESTRVPMVQP